MLTSLLATKTQIPQLPHQLVARSHLVAELEQEIPRHKLTLVSAPAGYGKSTLLAQWAHATQHPVAWLSLDDQDGAFDRFFRYLLAAWETVQADVMETPLAILLGGTAPENEAVLTAFINLASRLKEHTVFVLDDFHALDDPLDESVIVEALGFLLDHLPPKLHFALVTRTTPVLPLARYRATDQLWELGPARLAFQPQETADFLNTAMALDLTTAALQKVQARSEGWIAGLQLIALALQRGLTPELAEPDISGQHRFISDYFFAEVLNALPDHLQRFLLRTSILERLCGPLCAAVVETRDGQKLLEEVERLGLFLLPLDARREWYRYHPLFADFLRQQLQERDGRDRITYHRRAARWYLAEHLPEQAFAHAVDGDDVDLVLLILEQFIQTKLLAGEFRDVQKWLNSLPNAWRLDYPLIGLVESCLLFFTGQFDACIRSINEVERRLQPLGPDERRTGLAQVQAVRCSLACFQDNLTEAEAFAEQASRNLAAGDHFFRTMIYGSLGDTYRRHARWHEARACYLELLPYVPEQASSLHKAHLFGALADLELRQGHLQVAASYWRKALLAIQDRENWGRLPLPLTGWIYIRAAELFYEWNDLRQAASYLSQGLERAELGGDVRAILAGYLLAGRLRLSEGDLDTAAGYLERARPLVNTVQSAPWPQRFERLQLELWLAQKEMRAVAAWSDALMPDGSPPDRQEDARRVLTWIRALITLGGERSLAHASTILRDLLQNTEAEGRVSILIEGLALQALARWRQGDQPRAVVSLQRALELAEAERYVRLFVDLGPPLWRILQEAHARDVMPDYVQTLLAASASSPAPAGSLPQALAEPLTARELEILNLLAAGLTNREIAGQLTISPLTVKTHAANIYGKLGVRGRVEASARARQLNLLA